MSLNEEQARILLGAIMAAGPGSGQAWEEKVTAAIPQVAVLFSSDRTAERIKTAMEAQVYTGLFVSATLEESTKRYIVRTDAERTKDGVPQFDEIRTEPLWSLAGRNTEKLIKSFQVGDRLAIWKAQEPMKDRGGQTARVLYHVVRTRKAAAAEGETPGSPAAARTEGAPQPQATKECTPSLAEAPSVLDRFKALPPNVRGKIAAQAAEKGVTNMARLSGDDEFIILQLIAASLDEAGGAL